MSPKDWIEIVQSIGGWVVAAALWKAWEKERARVFDLLNNQNKVLALLRGEQKDEE